MAETTLDNLVLRSASVVSLNDRFSKVLDVPGQVLSEVKREPLVEDLCCDLEFRTVLLRKRLARVGPRGPRGLRPAGPRSSAALEGRFLGGRRCPCALWGLRLLSRRYGWAGKVLRARPLGRAGFNPNGGVRDPGPTSTTAPIPGQTNAWQHAPKQGWKPQFKRKVPTKEQLDQQLDDYMAMSKKHLDAQLDAYMAMAGDLDGEDDRKWYDVDCA